MRLIDADKYKCGKVIDAILSEHNFPIIKEINVSDIPTAYDPDKVVEKLENRRMDALRHLQENKGTAFGCASEWVYNAWNEAVEIVKGGGVDAKTDS